MNAVFSPNLLSSWLIGKKKKKKCSLYEKFILHNLIVLKKKYNMKKSLFEFVFDLLCSYLKVHFKIRSVNFGKYYSP